MNFHTYHSLYVFVLLFVFGVAPTGDDSSSKNKNKDEPPVRKLKAGEEILTTIEYIINRTLEKPYPRKAFGSIFRESITFEGKYNERKVDSDIVDEFKKVLIHFYASTFVSTDPIEILANYQVTHIATWFNLSFQTCTLYYGDDKQFETITKSCERLSQFLEIFSSLLSPIKAYQFAQFKKNSPKHIKTIENPNLKEKEAKKISKRLEKAIEVTDAIDPDINQCEEKENENEKKYCKLWITKLINQPNNFKLDHIFFNVYNGVEEKNFKIYSHDSYTSDYISSTDLWEYTPQLLEKVKEMQEENKERRNKITSYAVTALIQIIRFKMSKLGVDTEKTDLSSLDLEKTDYAAEKIERFFQGDEAATDTAS